VCLFLILLVLVITVIDVSGGSAQLPAQTHTGRGSGLPRLTDDQSRRLQEAGEEYGRWLAAHPGYWGPSRHHPHDINEATDEKLNGG
jgi:hypothetical protein